MTMEELKVFLEKKVKQSRKTMKQEPPAAGYLFAYHAGAIDTLRGLIYDLFGEEALKEM